jgi:predicted sugar kinase
MNKREIEEFFDDVIRAERLERSLMVAAIERDAASFSETRKQFQDLLCSLSNRARAEVGLPSIREERRAAVQARKEGANGENV